LKYIVTSLIIKQILKTTEGETFSLFLDLYFSSVGKSKRRIEPCNIKFRDVGEDSGDYVVEM